MSASCNFPEILYLVDNCDLPEGASSPLNYAHLDSDYVPNFVIQSPEKKGGVAQAILNASNKSLSNSQKTSNGVGVGSAAAASAVSIAAGVAKAAPFALMPSPVALISLGYLGYSMLKASREKGQSDGAADEEHQIQAQFDIFLKRYAVSVDNLNRSGAIFQPGHPKIGQMYRLHPLSKFSGGKMDGFYIPDNSYDQILLDEREAELMRLLVALGATKISISERLKGAGTRNVNGGVSAGIGVVNVDAKGGTVVGENSLEVRVRSFELSGSNFKRGDNINRNDFAWLPFEPGWETILFARVVGGCLRASIDLKQDTDYSNKRQISAGLKSAAYGGISAQVENILNNMEERSYVFDVEFSRLE